MLAIQSTRRVILLRTSGNRAGGTFEVVQRNELVARVFFAKEKREFGLVGCSKQRGEDRTHLPDVLLGKGLAFVQGQQFGAEFFDRIQTKLGLRRFFASTKSAKKQSYAKNNNRDRARLR